MYRFIDFLIGSGIKHENQSGGIFQAPFQQLHQRNYENRPIFGFFRLSVFGLIFDLMSNYRFYSLKMYQARK